MLFVAERTNRAGAGLTRGFFVRAALGLAMSIAVGVPSVVAQTVAWPVRVLLPPGAEAPQIQLLNVAVAGDIAVSAYKGGAATGYRVFTRTRTADGWAPPELLVQGQPADGENVQVDADPERIAVGLPGAAGGGRVDIYLKSQGGAWLLEQSLIAPTAFPVFGSRVSIRGDLLVVSSFGGLGTSHVDSFRLSSSSGAWIEAGYSSPESIGLGPRLGVTDGERLAVCLSHSCLTLVPESPGQWQVEASTPTSGSQSAVALDGGWLFTKFMGRLMIYRRAGSNWSLHQQIADIDTFDVVDGTLFVGFVDRSLRAYSLTVDESWEEFFSIPSAVGPVAMSGDVVLAGAQAFSRVGADWIESGYAGGIRDPESARFGAALAIAGDTLWMGSPGYAQAALGSGALWPIPVGDLALATLGDPLAPVAPAMWQGMGESLAVDGTRLAIASLSSRHPLTALSRVSIVDSVDPQVRQEIILPDSDTSIVNIDVALAVDTLAVTRAHLGLPSEVLVYRDAGAGVVHAQTLTLPASAPANSGFGSNVELRGDWLLAGKLMYRREGGADYQYVAALELPAGSVWHSAIALAADDGRVVVATVDITDFVGLVYRFDAAKGWGLTGRIHNGGFVIPGRCRQVAIGDPGIVCLATNSVIADLYLALPDPSGPDWQLVGAGQVSGLRSVASPGTRIAMSGPHVVVGWPNSQTTAEGVDTGRVIVMTLDEGIFASGFEASSGKLDR